MTGRTHEAHYSVTLERESAFKWRWRVYGSSDWHASGTAMTQERARKAADDAIAQRRCDLEYAEQREHYEVLG